jgi:hypothetical protein
LLPILLRESLLSILFTPSYTSPFIILLLVVE